MERLLQSHKVWTYSSHKEKFTCCPASICKNNGRPVSTMADDAANALIDSLHAEVLKVFTARRSCRSCCHPVACFTIILNGCYLVTCGGNQEEESASQISQMRITCWHRSCTSCWNAGCTIVHETHSLAQLWICGIGEWHPHHEHTPVVTKDAHFLPIPSAEFHIREGSGNK